MLIFSSLGSWLWLGDRLSARRLFGIVAIIAGMRVIGWEGLTGGGGERVWVGDTMFVVAGLFWACYTVASRYWSVEPLQAITIVSVFSMVLYVPAYFLFAEPGIGAAPNGTYCRQFPIQCRVGEARSVCRNPPEVPPGTH